MDSVINGCRVERRELAIPVRDYVPACVDVPRVGEYCRRCANYGRLWSCPPFPFCAERFWDGFGSLLLIEHKLILPAALTERVFPTDELSAQYRLLLQPHKTLLLDGLIRRESAVPGAAALAAGCCGLCTRCARKYGAPCTRPEVMRYSPESLGADVSHTLELYFGDKLLWAEDGRLPEHFILLCGLLMP